MPLTAICDEDGKMTGVRGQIVDGVVVCCEEEPTCCMYPAVELDDTYVAADLPATVYAKWGSRVNGTMTKGTDTFTSGTVTIRVNAGGTAWEFHDSSDGATSLIGVCLVRGDGGFKVGDDRVEDKFAPSYQVAISAFLSGTFTVLRESLCVWVYDGGQDCTQPPTNGVDYVSRIVLSFNPSTQQWIVSGQDRGWRYSMMPPYDLECVNTNSWANEKIGDQNTPDGNYNKFPGASATVS